MAISRAQLLKELLPGLNALFGLEYARYGEEHKEIYETETSERSFEEETKLAGFSAAPVKPEGQAIAYDNAQEAWTARYNHETIAMGFSITEEAIEDNLYDSLSARYTKALARAMAYTKQVKAAAVLNQGFNSAVTYGDGVSLFSTAHPLISGGTNSNRPATAKSTKRSTKPKPRNVALKKKPSWPVSLLLPSSLKVRPLRMTTPKRLGLRDTTTKPLPGVSRSPKRRLKITCMTASRLVIPKLWLVLWPTPNRSRLLLF